MQRWERGGKGGLPGLSRSAKTGRRRCKEGGTFRAPGGRTARDWGEKSTGLKRITVTFLYEDRGSKKGPTCKETGRQALRSEKKRRKEGLLDRRESVRVKPKPQEQNKTRRETKGAWGHLIELLDNNIGIKARLRSE